MFDSFPKLGATDARSLMMSQMSLLAAMNNRIFDGAGELACLNVNTARKLVADAAAISQAGNTGTGDAMNWMRSFYAPGDIGALALYGQQAATICSAVQNDVVKFAQESIAGTSRDMSAMSAMSGNVNAGMNAMTGAASFFEQMRQASETFNGGLAQWTDSFQKVTGAVQQTAQPVAGKKTKVAA